MLIKKYSNRRLYDTEESRYITLEELAEKVRAGRDARVVDAKTGEDLTQATLAQIIMESRGAARILPVPLLLQLIRLGDDYLAEFLGLYVGQSLEAYLQLKRGAQALGPLGPLAGMPFAAASALARLMMGGFSEGAQGAAPPPPSAPPTEPRSEVEGEMERLRRDLEELKREVHRKRK